jgi:hypothetical protein
VTLPSELVPYYSGQINTGSASYATPNPHQDIVAKVAFDPTVHDKALHVEAGGVLTRFAFYNPLDGQHYGTTGGGGSLNVNVEPAKSLRLFDNAFYSRGAGRYLIGLGPDVIIRGDGSPSPVGSSSLLIGVEHQATPRTAIQGYYGAARFDRNVAIDPATGGDVGFGYVGSPSNHDRIVTQGTLGFSHALWSDSGLGSLQVMAQYSHLFREPWCVTPGTPSNASLNLFYLKIRYSFPGAPPSNRPLGDNGKGPARTPALDWSMVEGRTSKAADEPHLGTGNRRPRPAQVSRQNSAGERVQRASRLARARATT